MGGFVARLAIALALLLIALLAAVTAFFFFAYALYLLLLNIAAPPLAAALTAVFLLLAALGLALIARETQRRPRRLKRDDDLPLEAETMAVLGNELGRRIRGLSEGPRNGGLLAALLAGFAFGASPALRALLRDVLKS